MTENQIEQMTDGYIECALFTADERLIKASSGQFDVQPFLRCIPKDTREEARRVCVAFYNANTADLADYPAKAAGYDLWYTRNGHGCGFWEADHCEEDAAERLTKAAEALGECHLWADHGWFKFE